MDINWEVSESEFKATAKAFIINAKNVPVNFMVKAKTKDTVSSRTFHFKDFNTDSVFYH